MPTTIAFVGAGPTTIYTLRAFLERVTTQTAITIFEDQPRAGLGTPYRPGWNDPAMLSNIASIEIPPIAETLLEWLRRQPRARLVRLGVDPDGIDDHEFYPRLALGENFLDQFHMMIAGARERGIAIEIATRSRVADIAAEQGRLALSIAPANGATFEQSFDQVVLATGHQWPEEPEVRPGYFLSPWPATALQRIAPILVGIRGSSLTAIDAAVALANVHGSFIETECATVEYRVSPGAENFRMTMMSRKGLLPEADFFHPVPYEPLSICTPAAMERLIVDDCANLLERSYDLFRRELEAADPAYAAHVGLSDVELDDFADRYFADRSSANPWEWAQSNLEEARANYDRSFTVPWRYAILRMHEVLALIVPKLDDDSLERFNQLFKPVFVDEYATVPHLSIERLLALHRAGCLEITALGKDHRVDTRGPEIGATVTVEGKRIHYPAFIDATGQRPLAIEDFPFPTLRKQGVVRDASDDAAGPKGVDVDDAFHPISDQPEASRLFCLSIPFILGRHPFVQGITSSHEMGEIVGARLAIAAEELTQ
ncbi:FAD-dependent urate hydroxylase HpyO/Asp monooxygenase CreE-like FAD/NAD(P)-binding domain-containing protein [Sphingomonas antarctica]|uniref:FAD/NAD(P)-binding protein n=1 Tax=Sphingomonas antarctica TaxID=2040274 RepID=UPI0039EABF3A